MEMNATLTTMAPTHAKDCSVVHIISIVSSWLPAGMSYFYELDDGVRGSRACHDGSHLA